MSVNITRSSAQQMFDHIVRSSKKQLAELLEISINNGCQILHNQAEEVDSVTDKQTVLAIASAIINYKPTLINNYTTEFGRTLAGHYALLDDSDITQSLNLVDDDILNDSAYITDVAKNIHANYTLQLRALKRGIVRLSQYFDDEPEPHCLNPKHLLLLFHKNLNDADIPNNKRQIFYQSFATECEKSLSKFYESLLIILQQQNILSDFENPLSKSFDLNTNSQATRGPALDIQQQIKAKYESAELALLDQAIEKELYDQQQVQQRTQLPVTPASQIEKSSFSNSTVSKLLFNYIAEAEPELNENTLSGVETLPIPEDQLIKKLSQLQADLREADLDEIRLIDLDAAITLQRQIQYALEEDAYGLNKEQLNIINLIQKLFTAILENADLDQLIKIEITRLQIPYIKVALLDVNILNDSSHPARLVLNDIAKIGLQVDDNQDPNYHWIQNIVEYLLSTFDSDISVFNNVLNKLQEEQQKLKAEAEQRVEAKRNKVEAEARAHYLKKLVLDQLYKFIADKYLPKQLYELVLKGFAPLLLRIYVRQGEDSQEWEAAVDLFRRIIESVQPRDSITEISKIVQHAPTIINDAKKMLGNLLKRENERDLLLGLKHIYKRKADELARRKEELTTVSPAAIAVDPFDYSADIGEITLNPESSDIPKPADILQNLPPELKPGTWCEVYIGKQLGTRRMKVLSIVKESAQIVFVDGNGDETRIKDALKFYDELDCERSRIIVEDNLFDKALATVLMNVEMAKR